MSADYSNESWRPVVGFEGGYSVSDHGRVRREAAFKNRPAGEILRPTGPDSGYAIVFLRSATKPYKNYAVHRVVAAAFLGPCPEKMVVNHLNGIKNDNRVENLEYATHRWNSRHAKLLARLNSESDLDDGRSRKKGPMFCPHCSAVIDTPSLLIAEQNRLGFTNAQMANRLKVRVQKWNDWKNGHLRISLGKLNELLDAIAEWN